MAVVQNLYNIIKLPASYLVEHDCNIPSYTLRQALKDERIVAIGDNLVFQQLRYMHNDYRDHRELFSYVTKLRNNAHIYKKQGEYKKAHILEQRINEVLYIQDIINVFVDGKKSDFHKFRTKGFYVNGIHYVYLCSGSGQIRRNTATFVNAEYRDQLVKILNCGLDEKTSEFCLAKYSAYFALSFSSILWVRTPRVCVVKDFFNILKDEKVDFICKDENGDGYIEERTMDLELNCADGQGIIDPSFAELWSRDMDLDYIPCSFVARSCFIKGDLVTFDFKDYAHQHNIFTIKDKWGKEYNIDEIDVLLSESQFKTSKYYSSWQDYCRYAEAGNIHWGVARYNKKVDDEYVQSNYQYIQALELSTEDIHELIQPTVKWIKEICAGDTLPALLYAFGPKSESTDYQSFFSSAQTTAMKAIIQNTDFLQDSYVQRKIYKNIVETINSAKLGKIWIRGNYQFCIADPLAQVQSALGLPVTGALKRDQVWSQFWVDRNVDKVDLCRSPMIDVHEHNPCDIYHDDTTDYWFKYINSGIIYSIYDTSCFRQEDSDYDGDIVLSTDNKYFIKGSHKNHNIITYEKGNYGVAKMTVPNITETVMKGFGTGVGGFSNTATIMYAMSAIFDKPGHEDQKAEIMTRIKLLREIVGQEIDRIKGADKPSIPVSWRKIDKILPTDTPEEITKKMRKNAMVVSKKPYFFRYLYPELNRRFKQFEASYDRVSQDMFGIKFKKLLKKENKTEEEKLLIKRYQKYSPLITAPCTMNKLCREFESIDFDIQFNKTEDRVKKPIVSKLPTYEGYFANELSPLEKKIVRSVYTSCNQMPTMKIQDVQLVQALGMLDDDDYREIRVIMRAEKIRQAQSTLESSNISNEKFLFYCNRLSKQYASFNWGVPWSVLEDGILKYIPQGKTACPIRDESAPYEYLGKHYYLKDLSNIDELELQKLLNSLLGDPEEIPDESLLEEIMQEYEQQEGGK